jgi:hypothetical protein
MAIVADEVLNELLALEMDIDPEGMESKIQFEIRNGYELEPPENVVGAEFPAKTQCRIGNP